MKKKILLALAAVVALCSFTAATVSTENVVNAVANRTIQNLVEEGYCSQEAADNVIASKIIDESYKAFVENDYDPSKALDRAAEIAVEQGWYSSTTAAKKSFKKQLELARKNDQLVGLVYQTLGL